MFRRFLDSVLIGIVIILGWIFPGKVLAQNVCRIVRLGNAPMAMVARPGKLSEAMTLLQANETMEAAQCCVACMPDVGTKVLITDRGIMSHTVRVLEGQFKGCVGDVVMESVGECK